MLALEHISKEYGSKKIIDDLSLTIKGPGLIGITGPSGCGKTTLLNIIGGIDQGILGKVSF